MIPKYTAVSVIRRILEVLDTNFSMDLQNYSNSYNRHFNCGFKFAIIKSENEFYFVDSHSCGPKDSTARNGRAYAIQCDDINELHRICRRATGSRRIDYTIDVQQNESTDGNEPVNIPIAEDDDRYQIQEQTMTVIICCFKIACKNISN